MDNIKADNRGFYARMLALALPIALQNMLSTGATLVDTAMVVRIGNVALASVGVAGRWSFLINIIFFGIASASSVLISQYWGVGDRENIQKTFSTGMALGLGVAAVYSAASITVPHLMISVFTRDPALIEGGAAYLRIVGIGMVPQAFAFITGVARRATEDVRIPVVAATVSMSTSIFLNWVLIYGNMGAPALGLKGAAIATCIAMYVFAAFYLVLGRIQKHFTMVSMRIFASLDRIFIKRYIGVAWPVLFNETMWAVAMNIYAAIFISRGSESYAAYNVYVSIQDLTFIFFVGICSACGIMVGKAVGSGRTDDAYNIGKRFLIMTPLMGVALGGLLIIMREPLLGLMQVETEYARKLASDLLLFYGCWVGIRNIPYTAVVGIIRPGGDTKMGFYLDVGTMYFWGIPIVAVLAFVFKVDFIWLILGMYLAEDSVKTVICIWYFRTKRWIRRLTQAGSEPSATKEG